MHYRKNLQKYTAFNLGFATSVVYQTLVPFFLTLIKLPQESDRRPYDSRGYWARSLIVVAISRRFPGLSGIYYYYEYIHLLKIYLHQDDRP